MSRAKSIRFGLLRFERRLRRRAERRMGDLRTRPGFWSRAEIVGGLMLGTALGGLALIAIADRRPVEPSQRVAFSVAELSAEPAAKQFIDAGHVAAAVAHSEDPAIPVARKSALKDQVEIANGVAEASARPPSALNQPPVTDAPPTSMEMPSVEHGPPEWGDVAKPPRQTRVAGLPIPPKPQWLRNAIEVPDTGDAPMIAVIVDDVGVNQRRSREAVRLPGPLTIAFIPYGTNLKAHVAEARRHGHEIMVHVPMEPLDPGADPGPNALLTDMDPDELLRRLRWGLDRFDGYVGVSNHMGSRFTTSDEGMRLVMGEMRRRGLLYVDSWTHNRSLGMPMSRRFRVPNAARDIFIDHDITEEAIRRRLGKLERIARRRGYAVGIAHPYALSMQLLRTWIVSVGARGFRIVPISAIVRHRVNRR